jgi:hypothetical protein
MGLRPHQPQEEANERSINPLKHIDRTENKFCIESPGENARSSKKIAVARPIRIAPIPHIAARPPATAASPVALALDTPLSTLLRPISAGTDGAQASATPQRKRFFSSSSHWRLRF